MQDNLFQFCKKLLAFEYNPPANKPPLATLLVSHYVKMLSHADNRRQ